MPQDNRPGRNPAPVYVARTEAGATVRISFHSAEDAPFDFARGRHLAAWIARGSDQHRLICAGSCYARYTPEGEDWHYLTDDPESEADREFYPVSRLEIRSFEAPHARLVDGRVEWDGRTFLDPAFHLMAPAHAPLPAPSRVKVPSARDALVGLIAACMGHGDMRHALGVARATLGNDQRLSLLLGAAARLPALAPAVRDLPLLARR